MTIDELKILLDIGNPDDVIKSHAKKCSSGWLFVDSNNGYCHLFDKNGKEKDINCLTKIDDYLFYGDIALTKIVVPSSVTSIGDGAFYNCYGLISATIPNHMTNIGSYAFSYCSGLTSVTIPDSVMIIRAYAFVDCCKLTSLTFKGKTLDEVKSMENYPFGIEDESIIKCEA